MTVALALLVGAFVVAWGGPSLLGRPARCRVSPVVLLVGWVTLVAGCLLTVAAAIAIAVLPGHGPAPRIVALLHWCLNSLRHGDLLRAEEVAGLVSGALLAGVVIRLLLSFRRHGHQQAALNRRHRDTLSIVAQREPGPIPTLWVPHDKPLAYSIAGRPGLIVATDGLLDRLSETGVAAVIEHERAHLRGRHHLLVGAARALAATIPWTPLTRRSPELVAAFVELAADAQAARRHGAESVREALLVMTGGHANPPGALAMADDWVELRLHHLDAARTGSGLGGCQTGVAAVTGLLLPVGVAAAVFAAAAFALCPWLLPL